MIASPAIKPDAMGITYLLADFGEILRQIHSLQPPRKIVMIGPAEMSIPMPIPVGDGTHVRISRFCSSSGNRIPSVAPIASAVSAVGCRLEKPLERIVAKPTQ